MCWRIHHLPFVVWMYIWLYWSTYYFKRYECMSMEYKSTKYLLPNLRSNCYLKPKPKLQWRHKGRDSVSNHQSHDCLLNRLFRRRSKKTSKPRVTGLCAGKSPVTGEFPAQMASNAENVSIWWRHHENGPPLVSSSFTHGPKHLKGNQLLSLEDPTCWSSLV